MKSNKARLRYLAIFAVILVLVFISIDLIARPGGGHSYSGGSSGGGGSYSGGDGGDALGIIIWLLFQLLPPYISIPLVIILIVLYYYFYKGRTPKQTTSSITYNYRTNIASSVEEQIQDLKNYDPNFSRVLFIDFVSSLYTKFYQYKNDKKKLATIRPFVSDTLFNRSQTANVSISEVVIGAINIIGISVAEQNTTITLEVYANYTSVINQKASRYIVTDRLVVKRKTGLFSLEPNKMQKLSCPSCGAPADFNDAGYCSYCGTLVKAGNMNWYIENLTNTYLNVINTEAMLSYSPEVGTDYPTVYSSMLSLEISNFTNRHKQDFNTYWQYFQNNIVKVYFLKIFENWQNLTWNNVRHLLTDRLWESFNFWIETYKTFGLKNMLVDTTINRIELAKIETDKFYESFTVRIFASVKDYVVDKSGKVLVGSASRPRYFSEYWTFVRYNQPLTSDVDISRCPNCGAPIDKMGQSGVCGYCNTKVNTGQFSWVLAIITQDEEYKG